MILAMFIVGMVITYLTIGLVSGRAYFMLKLKSWHETAGIHYKTKRQIEQEEKLEELEAKQTYQKKVDDTNSQRVKLVTTVQAAQNAVDDLTELKRALQRQIQREGSDAYVIKVEQLDPNGPLQVYDATSLTLGKKYEDTCNKLIKAGERIKMAHYDLDYFDKTARKRERETWQNYRSYGSRYCKNYEDKREEFKDEINPYAITMVFLWPGMATWFVGKFAVKHVINFGDKVLHADKLNNYVAPVEHRNEARIKALEEKDPELAKMYAELASTLEA